MTTPKSKFAGLALIAALCAGFTLGLTAPAWAGLDEGVAAYHRGDYATALREWHPLAEQGNAKAQYNLGIMYSEGKGVPQDYAEAVKWYRKAAEQGQAKRCYRKPAEQGQAEAQYNLGVMYGNGLSVSQDYAEAVEWWNARGRMSAYSHERTLVGKQKRRLRRAGSYTASSQSGTPARA